MGGSRILAVPMCLAMLTACGSRGGSAAAGPGATTLPAVESSSATATTIGLAASNVPACVWRGAVVNTDGASQRYATVLGFTNSTGATCKLPRVEQVVGVVSGGTVTAEPGGYFPIPPAADTVVAGDRAELVLTTTSLDLCSTTTHVPLLAVNVTMSDGSVIGLPVAIDAGCGLWYSQLGSWD